MIFCMRRTADRKQHIPIRNYEISLFFFSKIYNRDLKLCVIVCRFPFIYCYTVSAMHEFLNSWRCSHSPTIIVIIYLLFFHRHKSRLRQIFKTQPTCAGILEQYMGDRNRVGKGLSYRAVRAHICKRLRSP